MTARFHGIAAVTRLAWRRAAAAPGRWVGVACGVALAVALPVALAASAIVAGDHAARRTLAAVPRSERAVILTWNGGATPAVDRAARAALRGAGAGEVTRGLIMLPSVWGRTLARLAAIDPLARSVRLLSGRLPRGACRPRRCEVLHLDGPRAPPVVAGRGVRLVIVGRADLVSRPALGFTTRHAAGIEQGPGRRPVILASGDPVGLDALRGTSSLVRMENWSAPLALAGLHAWDLDRAIDRIAAQRASLDRRASGFTPTTPEARLVSARRRSETTAPRLQAAGAAAGAAIAAFLILAAAGMRVGLLAEDARLRRSGATAGQRAVLALTETLVPVVAGLVGGALLALAVAIGRARSGHAAVGDVLAETLRDGVLGLLVVAGASWALILVAARVPALAGRRLALVALAACLAALAAILAPRGGAGADPLPAAVLPLAGAAAGLALALVLPAAWRALARAAPRSRPFARVALLELARDPGPAAVAAAGLAVATGLAGFAFAYRATLDRSREDQAAHRVPLAATVLPGADLRSPLRLRPAAAWARLPGVGAVAAVVRRDAFAILGPTRDPVQLVALPAATLARLGAWRAPDAGAGRATLASRLVRPPFDRPGAGSVSLERGAAAVALPARAIGDGVRVTLFVREPGGALARIALGTASPRARVLRARVPAAARGGQVAGIGLVAPEGLFITGAHQLAEGGGGGDSAANGVLSLGELRSGSRRLALDRWRGHGAVGGRPSALRYSLAGSEPALLRPPVPSDRAPVPVLADPGTAHDAALAEGTTLDVLGVQLPARVVGVARRFPTVPEGAGFVVADAAVVSAALDARVPGSGEPRELWLGAARGGEDRLGPAVAREARRLGLRLRTRADVRRAIETEPVSREVLGALTAAALLAAVLAVVSVGLAVRRALRDGAHGLADLEAQGVGPARLRAGLRLRAAAIATAGVLPGAALGALLATLVTSAVRAGAVGSPDPPLVTVVPWEAGALAALALLLAAAGAGALAAAPALREDFPRAVRAAEAT